MTSAHTSPLQIEDRGLLRFLTCGSVDDGKSTLIGRLLFDTKTILADTLTAIERTSTKRGLTAVDLSLLTDGLQAEREQGITIDVAYRYFSTGTRKYIIADAPGHEQYTRNMVTAASTANVAIILIDARKGVLTQTRRHSYLAKLVGIPHVIVAVNKMDLVDYSQATYDGIVADYTAFAEQIGLTDVRFIPLSALVGDMIVDRGERLDWYEGPTLIDILEAAPAAHTEKAESFRFPVQYVCRPQASDNPELHDYRGFMGRVESGEIKVGDSVTVLPNGRTSPRQRHPALRSVARQGHPRAIRHPSARRRDRHFPGRHDREQRRSAGPEQAGGGHGLLAVRNPAVARPHLLAAPHHPGGQGQGRRHAHRVDINTLANERHHPGDERHRQSTAETGPTHFLRQLHRLTRNRRLHPDRRIDQQHRWCRHDRRLSTSSNTRQAMMRWSAQSLPGGLR
jgi:small GTP-binding protein